MSVYGLPDGFHRTAEVASDHIGRYDDFPFHVFAAYRIGTRGGFDVGDVAEQSSLQLPSISRLPIFSIVFRRSSATLTVRSEEYCCTS